MQLFSIEILLSSFQVFWAGSDLDEFRPRPKRRRRLWLFLLQRELADRVGSRRTRTPRGILCEYLGVLAVVVLAGSYDIHYRVKWERVGMMPLLLYPAKGSFQI